MRTLLEHPPSWVSSYVGIPFDRCNCYALTRRVYAERFGVTLPALEEVDASDASSASAAIRREVDGSSWRKAETPSLGSVGVFRVKGQPWHLGIAVARSRMLHAFDGTDSNTERFDSPVWSPRLIGWYDYAGPVLVRTRAMVIGAEAEEIEAPEGKNVEELVALAGVRVDLPGVRVYVGDREVPRHRWRNVKPRAGRRVRIGIVPQNGQALRIIASLAIIVASVYLGPQVAGFWFAGSEAAAAIATATMAFAGTLAVNALVPPPTPSISAGEAGARSPTIEGAGNEIRRFGVVPVVLGTYQYAPPYAAIPFTETVGDDQYLRALFCVGYGPLDIDNIRIGETSINEFEGVEYEIRPGRLTDSPVTLREEALSVALTYAGSWAVRTSELNASELSIDITLPGGLLVVANDGTYENMTVGFEVEYAPTGTAAFVPVNITSPDDPRPFSILFRTPDVSLVGTGTRTGAAVSWSAAGLFGDAPPAEVGSLSEFSWEATGIIDIPETGNFLFGVDGSSACELEIDGVVVASWYGTHDAAGSAGVPDFAAHSSTFGYPRRRKSRFRLRVESRNAATAAVAMGWKRPGGSWEAIPAAFIRQRSDLTAPQGYHWRAFNCAAYRSSFSITDNRAEQIRRTVSWAVPVGQYDVRIRRVTQDATSTREVSGSFWTALRTIVNQNPVKMKSVAILAVRIKATDQLNGTLSELNVRASSVVPDYDAASGEWIERPTSNPASLYRSIFQGPANARPVDDSRLDLAEFEDWHADNDAKGFTFNAVLDFEGVVFERLNAIAATGRATFGMRDGLFSVVRDKVQTVAVQHFTPRNSSGFVGEKSFPDIPHALRVQFIDAEAGYSRAERVVYDDGYDETNATRYEPLELFGVTDRDMAYRVGRYFIAVARLRPETYSLRVGAEQLACTRGDLVYVTHDVPLLGLSGHRVQEQILDAGGLVAGVVLDSPCEMQTGTLYSVRARLETGASFYREITTQAGEVSALYFESPVPADQASPQAGDLIAHGERSIESRACIVKAIAHSSDLAATLTLVDAAPAVHTAELGPIPDYDPGLNTPPVYASGPNALIFEQIRSDDFAAVRGADGVFTPRILAFLRVANSLSRPAPVAIQSRIRLAGSGVQWRYMPNVPIESLRVAFDGVEVGATYEIAVRAIAALGQVSAWTTATHTVEGMTRPPPDVESFTVNRASDGTRIFSWVLGDFPPDVVGVRIKYKPGDSAAAWADMTNLVDGSGVVEGASPFEANVPGSGFWRFGIVMVDAYGNESEHPLYVDKLLGAPRREGVAVSADAGAENWPGVKTGCYASRRGILRARSLDTWATIPPRWDEFSRWNWTPVSPIVYQHTTIDAGFLFDFQFDAVVEADGDYLLEVDYSSDNVDWQGYAPMSTYAGISVRARFARFRITVTGTPGQPIPVVRTLVMMLRAETVTEDIQDIDTADLASLYREAVGVFRVPISSGMFSAVRSVAISFNGTGAGWTWELVTRDINPGPLVRIYNPAGELDDALVDAVVRGIGYVEGEEPGGGGRGLNLGALRFDGPRHSGLLATL